MPAITTTDLNNAKLDVDHISDIANSPELTVTDRLGHTKRTIAGINADINAAADLVLNRVGYAVPVAYASGISLTLASQTVDYNNVIYAPLSSELPFMTSAWVTDVVKFRVIQVTDGHLINYTPDRPGSLPTNVQDALRLRVNVEDFLIAGEIDATGMLERAIASGAGEILLQDKTYSISRPLYLDGGQTLKGMGSAKTIILKTTTTVGSGSTPARSGSVIDSYAKNAIIILRHANNGYNYNTTLDGIQLKSDGYIVEYGIYAPRMTHALFKDVYIFRCRYGFVTHDAWLNTFIKVIANSDSIDPEGVPAVGATAYGWTNSYGFWWKDDGSGNPTGTSLNAIDCWARDCSYGWHIYGLQYSTLNSCASDNISKIPYRLHLARLTLNSCGTEKAQIGQGSYSIETSYVTMNSCQSQTQRGSASGTTAGLFISGGRVVLNACQFEDFTVANATYNVIIQSGAKVINNGSMLPANGNAFIGFGSGSQLIDNTTVPPTIRSEASGSLARYVQGRIRDNEVIEKSNKSVPSAGTTIATFTCNGSGGVEYAAARIKICWFDSSFASAIGISNIEVLCYQDSATNYRQVVNASVNVGAGNSYTTPPTYTLTRSGNVWSLVMTPAHGDCTVRTITAEVENVNGFAVALT